MFIVFLKNCTLRLYAFMTLCFLIRNIEKYSKIGYCRDSGNALNYEFCKGFISTSKDKRFTCRSSVTRSTTGTNHIATILDTGQR